MRTCGKHQVQPGGQRRVRGYQGTAEVMIEHLDSLIVSRLFRGSHPPCHNPRPTVAVGWLGCRKQQVTVQIPNSRPLQLFPFGF